MRAQILLGCLAWLSVGAVTGCFAVDYRYHVVDDSSPGGESAGGSGVGGAASSGGPGSSGAAPGSNVAVSASSVAASASSVAAGSSGSGGSSSDPCLANPITLTPPGGSYDGILGVGEDYLEPSCGSKGKPEVIFAVTPTVTGNLSMKLTPALGQDTTFFARTGCGAVPTGQQLTCTASGGGLPLALSFLVVSGETYYVVVDGDPQGFTLDLTLVE